MIMTPKMYTSRFFQKVKNIRIIQATSARLLQIEKIRSGFIIIIEAQRSFTPLSFSLINVKKNVVVYLLININKCVPVLQPCVAPLVTS